jgi:hypothetical protein
MVVWSLEYMYEYNFILEHDSERQYCWKITYTFIYSIYFATTCPDDAATCPLGATALTRHWSAT